MAPTNCPRSVARRFALASALVVVASASAAAQTPPVRDPVPAAIPRPTRILGVFDETNGTPIQGVEVTDMLTGTSAVTTVTGTVNLAFLTPGGSEIRIRKVGYEVQTMDVAMTPRDTTAITVVLKRVTELPTVVTRDSARHFISPSLRAFEERRASHTAGYFIDEKTLRKEDGRPLGNVLVAHAPGANVRQLSSANFLLKSPRCSNGGQPDVYLDGVPLAHVPDPRWPKPRRARNTPDPGDDPFDLSQFQVSDLAGVEFYPDNATMPVQFSGTAKGCGALMLWTRER
jgi:hypothetical protein